MPPEGLIPDEVVEQDVEEDFASWDTQPSDPEFEDPYSELYALIEQDLWMGHVRDTD
jgi:hypothetical protein